MKSSLFAFAAACASHSMASRLDDPSRDAWQHPDEVVAAMHLAPTMTVADVGAGTGYFTVRLARVAAQVIAVDVDPQMLQHVAQRTRLSGNVSTQLATHATSGLSASSVDAILVVHVWHHIHDRAVYAQDLASALKPGGRVFVVDFTRDASHGPPPELRLAPEQVVADFAAAGLDAHVLPISLPDQYMVEAVRAPR